MHKNTSYTNKYFSILGDSISTFEGYSEPKSAVYYDSFYKRASGVVTLLDTWWGQVIEKLGGKLLVNHSWSGSRVTHSPFCEVPSFACSNERTSALGKEDVLPDVIIVFMGVNDWGAGVAINSENPQEKNADAFFLTAYESMLKKLKVNYPKAEIWCMTLPISCCLKNENFAFMPTYAGRHIAKYCQAIQSCAAQYDCRVIDLYNCGKAYDTIDGFHPNVSGMQTLAQAVMEEI